MKILLVNKFYYYRGGDTTAVLTTEKLLSEKGHSVAVFSMQYPQNMDSPYRKYFPEEVDFASRGLSKKMSAAIRLFRSSEVGRNFNKLLDDFNPDVVHLHNIHSYISPLVAEIAHKRGIRVVWTLHDYKLICPSYSCRRDGKPCELCFNDKFQAVKHSCMKNSFPASLLAYAEAIFWNRKKLERLTDRFISPSNFLKNKMVSAGFKAEQIEVLNNFMYKQTSEVADKGDYYCYTGRISEEKGVQTLLEAASRLPFPLKIVGDGPMFAGLKKQYENSTHIEFTGRMSSEQLFPVVRKARFLIIPSVWYENNPYSVIEALCMGTPVLGANIGGIPELVNTDVNGDLFPSGDVNELQLKIIKCFNRFDNHYDFMKIATEAQNKFSPETFYKKLMTVYDGK